MKYPFFYLIDFQLPQSSDKIDWDFYSTEKDFFLNFGDKSNEWRISDINDNYSVILRNKIFEKRKKTN
jgi:hypothetical protein